MDGLREFLDAVRRHHLAAGHLLAVLHLAIGRRISKADGTVLSAGVTWRQLSELLRVMRWDKEAVREVGLNPDDLPPRDRQRFWYQTIASAGVDSPQAVAAADQLAEKMAAYGFVVGPPPAAPPPPPPRKRT